MAVFSAIASAIGSVVSGIGSAVGAGGGLGGLVGAASAAAGIAGTFLQYKGMKEAQAGQERAEALRLRQMNLESARERRTTMRQAIISRAQALSASTQQGAVGSGPSAGLGNIASASGGNINAINQGEEIGTGMFQANRQIAAGQTTSSMGSAIQGFGSFLNSNFGGISRTLST